MTIHGIILGFLIATLSGAAYHMLRGGTIRRLGLYLLSANISFFVGHGLSELIHWQLLRLGAINLFPALLATFLGLILTSTLAGEEPVDQTSTKRRRKSRK